MGDSRQWDIQRKDLWQTTKFAQGMDTGVSWFLLEVVIFLQVSDRCLSEYTKVVWQVRTLRLWWYHDTVLCNVPAKFLKIWLTHSIIPDRALMSNQRLSRSWRLKKHLVQCTYVGLSLGKFYGTNASYGPYDKALPFQLITPNKIGEEWPNW
jgi:hypothetical protein